MSKEKVELQFSTEPAPEIWMYEPQEDITFRELALLLPMFCGMKSDRTFEYMMNLPEECKRHFRRVG